MYMKCFSVFL